MKDSENKRRVVKFLSVDKRRSCNAFKFRDMVTGEIIEVTAKGLQQLLKDIGVIGLELSTPKKAPSNAKRMSAYHNVISTSLGDDEHGQREIIPTRTNVRSDRDTDR
jgi:hypothetical protein